MHSVQKDLHLAFKPSSYWNYRFVKFTYTNSKDESAYYVSLCEVYYENDVPHSYGDASPPCVESLEEEYGSIEDAVVKASAFFAEKLLGAAQKPILDSAIFEKSSLD